MHHACPRCEGKGQIKAFSGVMGGVCFRCNGRGAVEGKAATASTKWACEYAGKVLFWIKAKNEAQAFRAAVRKMNSGAPAFAGLTTDHIRVFSA